MNWKTSDKAIFGYITALVLFIITFFFTFYQTGELLRYTKELKERNFVINHLTRLLIQAKDFENEFRYGVLKKTNTQAAFSKSYSVMEQEINHLKQIEPSVSIHSRLDSIDHQLD